MWGLLTYFDIRKWKGWFELTTKALLFSALQNKWVQFPSLLTGSHRLQLHCNSLLLLLCFVQQNFLHDLRYLHLPWKKWKYTFGIKFQSKSNVVYLD